MPKVSIIVPVYNSEKYVGRLIESLRAQDFTDFEAIFINDGSKDNSLRVLKEFAKKDARIRVFSQKNQGIAKTRNFGIKKARGEYLMFMDNDDWVLPGYISKYVAAIGNSGADIVIGGYQRIDNDGKVIMRKVLAQSSEWSKYIIMAPWAKIYRREFVVSNKLEFLDYKIGEDVYFSLSAYNKTRRIKILENDDSYIWFYNNKSVSNTGQKGLKSDVDVRILLDAVFEKLGKSARDEFLKYYFRRYTVWYLLFSGRSSTPEQFLSEHRRLSEWLKEKGILKTLSPWSRKLSGEDFKTRMSVFMIRFFEKTHTLSLFAKVYCTGGAKK